MILRHALFNIFLFLFVFSAGALCLNAGLRHFNLLKFDRGRLDFKLDLYLEEYSDAKVLFVGTSRTDRQIDIPFLESETEKRGCPISAYNLGVPNLTYEEMLYIFERIKHLSPNLIILEEPIYAQHDFQKIETDRLRSFSTWNGTALRLENIWTYQEDVWRKLYRTVVNLTAFAYEQSNLGHLSKLTFPETSPTSTPIILADTLRAQRGFVSMDQQGEVDENISNLRKKFETQKDNFAAKLDREKEISMKPSGKKVERTELLQHLVSLLATKSIIMFPPLENRRRANFNLSQEAKIQGLNVLNYNDPYRYSQFWNIENWYDKGHLNAAASQELTALIAKDLCPLLKEAR